MIWYKPRTTLRRSTKFLFAILGVLFTAAVNFTAYYYLHSTTGYSNVKVKGGMDVIINPSTKIAMHSKSVSAAQNTTGSDQKLKI